MKSNRSSSRTGWEDAGLADGAGELEGAAQEDRENTPANARVKILSLPFMSRRRLSSILY